MASFSTTNDKTRLLETHHYYAERLEKTGRLRDAIKSRLFVRDQANALLKAEPVKCWPLYITVLRSHMRIAHLASQAHEEELEFQSLREHLGETEPYLYERHHDDLLARTAVRTPAHLKELREACADLPVEATFRQFTASLVAKGAAVDVNICINDSWKSVEDQFAWLEHQYGGTIDQVSRRAFCQQLSRGERTAHFLSRRLRLWVRRSSHECSYSSSTRHSPGTEEAVGCPPRRY